MCSEIKLLQSKNFTRNRISGGIPLVFVACPAPILSFRLTGMISASFQIWRKHAQYYFSTMESLSSPIRSTRRDRQACHGFAPSRDWLSTIEYR